MQLILTPMILQLVERKPAQPSLIETLPHAQPPHPFRRPWRKSPTTSYGQRHPLPGRGRRRERANSPAIRACPWAWPTSPPCCSRKFLKYDPKADPTWPDRDRFVLSAGHGSMLIYSPAEPDRLSGGVTIEEIKAFPPAGVRRPRAIRNMAIRPGVETTTGPLGQGLATSVGMAHRRADDGGARFGAEMVDHHTYVVAGDGCLMEGISHEAISTWPGHLRLRPADRIVLDDNEDLDRRSHLAFHARTDQVKRASRRPAGRRARPSTATTRRPSAPGHRARPSTATPGPR